MLRRSRLAVVTAAGVTLLLSLSLPHFGGLMAGDEHVFVQWVSKWLAGNPVANHPPGYTAYLSVPGRFVGVDAVVFRVAGAVLVLAAVPVVAVTVSLVAETSLGRSFKPGWRETPWALPALAVVTFAVSPGATSTAPLVDMESAYVLLTASFFAWFVWAVELERAGRTAALVGSSVLVAALFWVKLGIIPPLFAATTLYLLVSRRLRRLTENTVAFLLGGGVFYGTWVAFARLADISPGRIFGTDAGHVSGGLSVIDLVGPVFYLKSVLWVLYKEALWLWPPLVVLAGLWFVVPLLRERFSLDDPNPLVLFGLFTVLVIGEYAVVRKVPYGFPKYVMRLTPVLAVVFACTVARLTPFPRTFRGGVSRPASLGVAVAALFGVSVASPFLLGDPYLIGFQPGRALDIPTLLNSVRDVVWFVAVGGGLTAVAVLAGRVTDSAFSSGQVVALALLFTTLGPMAGVSTVQAGADYDVNYFYGESQMEDVIDYVETTYPPEQGYSVGAGFDVKHYFDLSYEETYRIGVGGSLDRGDPDVIVMRQPLVGRFGLDTNENYTRVTSRGQFVVFGRTSQTNGEQIDRRQPSDLLANKSG